MKNLGLPYGKKEPGDNGKMYSMSINGERYVYYERLRTDKKKKGEEDWRKELYNKANTVFKSRIKYGGDLKDISGFFAGLASYEFSKETALLEKHFGKTGYDPNSPECGKALIEAYNEIFNIQEVFERNRLVIANSKQKNLVSFFPGYLDKALENFVNSADFNKNVKKIIKENDKIDAAGFFDTNESESDKLKEAIKIYINDHSLDITEAALELMFDPNVKVESGVNGKITDERERERLQNAYKDILKALKEFKNKGKNNPFVKGAVETYRIDKLGDMLIDGMGGTEVDLKSAKNKIRNFKFDVELKKKGKNGSAGPAGIFTELFGIFAAQVNISNKHVKVDGFHTGEMKKFVNQKVDMMFLIGANKGAKEAMERKLENFEGKGRGTNARDIQNLAEEIFRNFGNDNTFMIFVNSKNWTLNSKFKNGYIGDHGVKLGGYSAGSAIDLNTWDDIMHQMNIRGRDFIFTIMQLIPHAIGNPNGDYKNKEAISLMFARAIGTALFDDFKAEDPIEKSEHGFNIVHLLYLNGVYVPLSVFYTLLSQAFGKAQNALDRDDLVGVDFDLPEDILYPTQQKQNIAARSGIKPWAEQSRVALNSIKVSYHFFKGFKDFMEEFYKIKPK